MCKAKFENQFGETSTLVYHLATLVWVGVRFEKFYFELIIVDTDESFAFKPYVGCCTYNIFRPKLEF